MRFLASYWWLLLLPVVLVLWLLRMRQRSAIGWLNLILLFVFAGVDLLTRPKARPPAWLVGSWRGEHRLLEVDSSGTVTFRTRGGKVQSEAGGRFMRLANDTLTYRVFFVPNRIRIDSGRCRTRLERPSGWKASGSGATRYRRWTTCSEVAIDGD